VDRKFVDEGSGMSSSLSDMQTIYMIVSSNSHCIHRFSECRDVHGHYGMPMNMELSEVFELGHPRNCLILSTEVEFSYLC